MEIKDKVALIAGGARIGQTVAEELAHRGCHIALTYRSSKASAEDTVRKVKALGVKALTIHADLQKENDNQRVPAEVMKGLGRLDILIHMASLYQKTPLESIHPKAWPKVWEDQLNTDLRSAYLLAVNTMPLMRQRGAGRMIFFADWVAASGRPHYREFVPYYIAKRGVIGLAEGFAFEWAPEILVNAVAPGPIMKPAGLSPEEDEKVRKSTPLGRWGGAEEIAKTVLFLIQSDFVTGECIRVDGGRHLY
jgi:NAD(P)-dependent dehydrogenase (short-subunit alcohol dehydrogenase family)